MFFLKVYRGLPGTGKTSQLLSEIESFLNNGFNLSDMCINTFRRSMAKKISEKLKEKFDASKVDLAFVGTTHGICRRIGNIENVATEYDKQFFCVEIMKIPYAEREGRKHFQIYDDTLGEALFSIKSWLTANLQGPDAWWRVPISKTFRFQLCASLVEKFLDKWRLYKDEEKRYDFDDMLRLVYENGTVPPVEILIIDEFQDFTPIQYEIYKIWASGIDEIILAGDPTQCIYSFFGTTPKFLEMEVSKASTITLPVTYRLPQCIWDYARKVINYIELPEIECNSRGGEVKSITSPELKNILHSAEFLHEERSFFLFRTNHMAQSFSRNLVDAGIPFLGHGGWAKREINLFNSIIKLKLGVDLTTEEMEEIVRVFPAGYFLRSKKSIREQLKRAGEQRIFWEFSFDTYLKDEFRMGVTQPSILENTLASQLYPTTKKKIGQAMERHRKVIDSSRMPVISTIHGAKGIEADNVFVFDNITGKIVREKSHNEEARNEESRIFFVACTRPKKRLFIVRNFFPKQMRYYLQSV